MCSSFFAINLCCLICFLQPQHFEDMPFLTFYRIPQSGIYTKYLFFLSEFSKPKMALELTNKSRWFKCSMHGGTGKHQTLEIRWWASTSLFLSWQSSSFSSSFLSSSEPSFLFSVFLHTVLFFKASPSGAFTLNRVTLAPWEVMPDSLWNKGHSIAVSSVLQLQHNKKNTLE